MDNVQRNIHETSKIREKIKDKAQRTLTSCNVHSPSLSVGLENRIPSEGLKCYQRFTKPHLRKLNTSSIKQRS